MRKKSSTYKSRGGGSCSGSPTGQKGKVEMNTYEVNGRVFPIAGYVKDQDTGIIAPVLDIPMMSDARWREITETPKNLTRMEASSLKEVGK